MAISTSNTQLEFIIPPTTGAVSDNSTQVLLRVTVRDENNALITEPVQVQVTANAVGLFHVTHTDVTTVNISPTPEPALFCSFTQDGVVEVPLTSGTSGDVTYTVKLGLDDDQLAGIAAYPQPVLAGKPERDYPVGTYSVPANLYLIITSAFTIDAAWLAANATLVGSIYYVRNGRFTGTCTLEVSDVAFVNCSFAGGTGEDYSLVTNSHTFTATYCAFGSGDVAAIKGPGGYIKLSRIEGCKKHGADLTQGGANNYVPTTFEQSVFRNCNTTDTGSAYGIYGAPFRNVALRHCWLDFAGANSPANNSGESKYQHAITACIRNESLADPDIARSPALFGCWVNGGRDNYIEVVTATGGGTNAGAFIFACKFGDLATYAAPPSSTREYASLAAEQLQTHGNYVGVPVAGTDRESGELLSNTEHPQINRTAGPRHIWPQTATLVTPTLTWNSVASGGSGSGGSGGSGGVEPPTVGVMEHPDENVDIFVSVRETELVPVGTGGGTTVLSVTKITGNIVPATPEVYDPTGGGDPPNTEIDPLIVEWDVETIVTSEGATCVIGARLYPFQNNPLVLDINGYTIPITYQFISVGGAAAASSGDLPASRPTSIVFPPGAEIASVEIPILEDGIPEVADETFVVKLEKLTQTVEGQEVDVVVPGARDEVTVTILGDGVVPPTVRQVFFPDGQNVITINEDDNNNFNVPFVVRLGINGNPDDTVLVDLDFDGTATYGADWVFVNQPNAQIPSPSGAQARVRAQFVPTTNGTVPPHFNILCSLINDTLVEPQETMTVRATVVTTSIAELAPAPLDTLDYLFGSEDVPEPDIPAVGWQNAQGITIREPVAVGALRTAGVTLRSVDQNAETNLQNVGPDGLLVNVRVLCLGASPPLYGNTFDFDILEDGVWTLGTVNAAKTEVTGTVRFAPGSNGATITVRVRGDVDLDDGEQFQLIVEPSTDNTYVQSASNSQTTVTILDPLGADTELFVNRFTSVTGPTLVRASVYVGDGYNPEDGFVVIDANNDAYDAQWHPVAYRAGDAVTAQPDVVHVIGYVPNGPRSVPGAANALKVAQKTSVTNPINPVTALGPVGVTPAVYFAAVTGGGLELALSIDANGHTDDLTLDLASAQCVVGPFTENIGGGPNLFQRYRRFGALSDGTYECTAARVYLDCRMDLPVVVLHVNWGNFKWKAPDGSFTHYEPNPHVDGEVYFKHLRLQGIPAGWKAVLLNSNGGWSEYAGGSYVDIIKANSNANERHFVAPLRGDMQWIALYLESAVSVTTATEVLKGYDIGYAFGGIGMDRHDAMGEHGLPLPNPEQIRLQYLPTNSSFVASGINPWDASEMYANDWLQGTNGTRYLAAIAAGKSVGASQEVRRQKWWLGFGPRPGDDVGGDRIDMSQGSFIGKYKLEADRLELKHNWHRCGTVAWNLNDSGGYTTEVDFTVTGATGEKYIATAQAGGKSGQRMAHQHFYSPEWYQSSGGVPANMLYAPGRKRAEAKIELDLQPSPGDYIVVPSTGNSVPSRQYIFVASGTAAAVPPVYNITIKADKTETLKELHRIMLGHFNPGMSSANWNVFPRYQSGKLYLDQVFAGVYSNAVSVTHDPPLGPSDPERILATGFSGGLNDNAGNIRPWNYLNPAERFCTYDLFLSWHRYSISGQNGMNLYSYHIWDWPHMGRIARPQRDLWWLYFDPLAYDLCVDYMGLGMQCLTRYNRDPDMATSPWYSILANSMELSHLVNYNLYRISDGLESGLLLHGVAQGFYEAKFDQPNAAGQVNFPYPANAADDQAGLNYGTWGVKRANIEASSGVAFDPGNPSHYEFRYGGGIDRGWGWTMAQVARGYAVSPALQRNEGNNSHFRFRESAHSDPAGSWTSTNRSWFNTILNVIYKSSPLSGATNSDDTGIYSGFYNPDGGSTNTGFYGEPNFVTRIGAYPGGPFNGSVQPEPGYAQRWYPHVRFFQTTYILTGMYAIQRRVYSWVDDVTTALPTDDWYTQTRNNYAYVRRVYRASYNFHGQLSYFNVPASTLTGIGVPGLDEGQEVDVSSWNTSGSFGRFNAQGTGADPDVMFEDPRAFYICPYGGIGDVATAYDFERWLIALFAWRLYGDQGLLDMIGGHIGFGGLPFQSNMASIAQTVRNLLVDRLKYSGRYQHNMDQIGWIVQWLVNNFGASPSFGQP